MGTLASLLFVNHVSLLPLQHLLHLLFSVLKRLLPSCLTCLASSSFVYVVFSVSPSQLPCLIIQSTPSFESTAAAAAKSLQSCPTLCDPIDGSPPGSPVPGILQARTLLFPSTCLQISIYYMVTKKKTFLNNTQSSIWAYFINHCYDKPRDYIRSGQTCTKQNRGSEEPETTYHLCWNCLFFSVRFY